MKEFRLIGKAFEIGNELQKIANEHKGMTLAEFLEFRKERLSRTIDNQLDEIDKSLRNGKR